MTVDRVEWTGLLAHDRGPQSVAVLSMPQRQGQSGSGAFLGLCDDGRQWWIKPHNNIQGGRVCVSDQVLARAGALIGGPVCEVCIVQIPHALAGWEFRQGGHRLEPGLAHASLHIDGVLERRDLASRGDDDNRRRHAGVYAVWDWCWGGDDQWLYSVPEENRLYSHDHGHYLPDGPNWTEKSLVDNVDQPRQYHRPVAGVDADAMVEFADRLDAVERGELAEILRSIPPAWDATEPELEALGYFLERRATAVANRLRDLASTL